MAQTIKLKRSGTQGAAPTTSNLALGEVAINTYDGKMYIKKSVGGTESIVEIGGSGAGSVSYLEAGMTEYEYTATSNQTTFSGSDSNSATLSYTANSIMVFLNGVLQDDGVDYTATNGTSVVFGSALTANDEVRIIAIDTVASTSSLQNPTKLDAITTVNGQAAYSLTVNSSAYTPSSQNALIVSLNGITQEPGDSFTISGSTITFSPALVTGDVVDYIVDMGRAVTIGQYDSDLVVSGELEVTGDIIGDLRGAILFKAQAGENLTKCDAVYISGISGNTTVVSKADADDAAKMPAFGIVAASATSGQPVDIYTFGTLSSVDTSTPGWSIGDELYVSTTAGALTNSAPTGESALIQKIAKVTRVDSSAGSIKIMGAGRSNAVPNLDDGDIFIGNASNQAVTAALDTSIVPENGNLYYTDSRVDSRLASGNVGNIVTTGYIAGPSTFTIDPAAVGDNTGTLVVAGNLQVDGTTTTINSTTMTVDDLNITLASGAANAAAANGAGITVDGANATLTYNGTNDDWNFNKTLNVTGDLSLVDSPFPRITLSDSDGTNQKTLIDQSGGFASLTAWNDSSHGTLDFKSYNNTTTRLNMRIDSSGNVGIGVTPEAWNTYTPIQVQQSSLASFTNGDARLSNNAYYSSGWKYIDSRYATQYLMDASNGLHTWSTAASGTADGAITWSERMRIDSSGNVLVGKNVANSANTGVQILPEGDVGITRDGSHSLLLNRLTSNGDIILFRKDGTTIGSIGSEGGDSIYIGNGDTGLKFSGGADVVQPFNPSTGAARDAAIDLGTSGARFKNLYLSGNMVVGASGSTYSAGALGYSDANWGFIYRPPQVGGTGAHLFEAYDGTDLVRIEENSDMKVLGNAGRLIRQYSIPNTGSSSLWIRLGTAYLNQDGQSVYIKLVTNQGYNASNSQDAETFIRFKTGNNASYVAGDGSSGNFYANGRFVRHGNGASPSSVRAVQLSTTTYEIWVLVSNFSGGGSFYEVSWGQNGTWTHSGTTVSTSSPPGVGTSYAYKDFTHVGGSTTGGSLILPANQGIYFDNSLVAANHLDDYEEGTWTPVLTGTAGIPTVTYSFRSGYYIKIGNKVTVRWGFRIGSISGGAGTTRITGLPYTAKSYGAYQQPSSFANSQGLTTNPNGPVLFYVEDAQTSLQGRLMNSNADTLLPLSYYQANAWCIGTAIYDVA